MPADGAVPGGRAAAEGFVTQQCPLSPKVKCGPSPFLLRKASAMSPRQTGHASHNTLILPKGKLRAFR